MSSSVFADPIGVGLALLFAVGLAAMSYGSGAARSGRAICREASQAFESYAEHCLPDESEMSAAEIRSVHQIRNRLQAGGDDYVWCASSMLQTFVGTVACCMSVVLLSVREVLEGRTRRTLRHPSAFGPDTFRWALLASGGPFCLQVLTLYWSLWPVLGHCFCYHWHYPWATQLAVQAGNSFFRYFTSIIWALAALAVLNAWGCRKAGERSMTACVVSGLCLPALLSLCATGFLFLSVIDPLW